MTTPLDAGQAFFSFPRVDDPARHPDYNAWHQLDHRPENLALPGVLHGDRWVRTPDCTAAGDWPDPLLAGAQYLAMYWFAEPVAAAVAEWKALGDTTLQQGRRPELGWTTRTSMGMYRPIKSYLAATTRISAAALPFRPHRGIHLTVTRVDEPTSAGAERLFTFHDAVRIPQLLALPGAIGAWTFRSLAVSGPDGALVADGAAWRITLCWLESDPIDFAAALSLAEASGTVGIADPELAAAETVLASGPLRTIEPWHWDWFEEHD